VRPPTGLNIFGHSTERLGMNGPPRALNMANAGQVSGAISTSETDNPVDGRPGCPHRSHRKSSVGGNYMRIQRPLPERYTDATQDELAGMIGDAKRTLGDQVFILGHHYQRDEVMRWADARGDSYRLSVLAQQRPEARYIVFCGVHFMAESADVLTNDSQAVILPDLNAGCSMADMADLEQVEEAWEELGRVLDIERVLPVTYMNSSAALKSFVGRHGGAVCTSTNARAVLEWGLRGDQAKDKVLFFPDQHLGRNTGLAMGYQLDDMRVWDPRQDFGGLSEVEAKDATFLLWKGHCSVHQRFRPEHIAAFRADHPGALVLAHPECSADVCQLADAVGSTDFIIRAVEAAPAGAVIAVGTEIHLVNRLNDETPDKTVLSLDPLVCPCSTMFRIDAPHLAWVLENLVAGNVINQITVDPETAEWARVALQRMLDIT
jgi:quinolinate synthase